MKKFGEGVEAVDVCQNKGGARSCLGENGGRMEDQGSRVEVVPEGEVWIGEVWMDKFLVWEKK